MFRQFELIISGRYTGTVVLVKPSALLSLTGHHCTVYPVLTALLDAAARVSVCGARGAMETGRRMPPVYCK